MKVIKRPHTYGSYLVYEDVEDELALSTDKVAVALLNKKEPLRVLPAPYFYEKRLYFWLRNRFEPGENKTFPNGGFEVVDEAYAVRSFDLDQVILHPEVIKHQKTIDKMRRTAEKETIKRERQHLRALKRVEKAVGGKRGRRALSDEEKTKRETERLDRSQRSGGKRGRPKRTDSPTEPKAPKLSTGKRGRPPISEEKKAAKLAEIIARKTRSGGKRGRPKNNTRAED
jgi:hypothetical protein